MRRRQPMRGAVLLFAMLVVALVATLASGSLWKQWRSVEVEAAERVRVQSDWLLTGGLDWVRLLLREDARAGTIDHLREPWALPFLEARIDIFAGSPHETDMAAGGKPGGPDAFLSGQVSDMQSRLNATNLAGLGRISEKSLAAFARLFDLLGLPPAELAQLAENMRMASDLGAEGTARTQSPLAPQRTPELVSMGLSPATLLLLEPHVTVLPARTPVNLNTASAEVIYSAIAGITLADAQRLVQEREASPLNTLADAARVLGRPEASLADNTTFSVASRYFKVNVQLRLGQAVSQATALLQRDGLDVVVMQRERGPAHTP